MMAVGLNRRTFLRGAAGAAGMGLLGGYSSKLKFIRASEAVMPQDDPVIIPVFLVPTGRRNKMKILVPDSAANRGDSVVWMPKEGVSCVEKIIFTGGSPFDTGEIGGDNCTPNTDPRLTGRVRDDATTPNTETTYTYNIHVRGFNGKRYTVDPDLDIVG